MRFEYRILVASEKAPTLEARINDLGADGWELVTVVEEADGVTVLYFTREAKNKKRVHIG